MLYRIEARVVCSDGYIGGWSNWSKKYVTMRQALQGVTSFRNGPHNTSTSSYGDKICYNHWEYRVIHFYTKDLQVSE